jgi:hypothetical protein
MRATGVEEGRETLEIECDGAQGIDEANNLRQNGKERERGLRKKVPRTR